MKAYSGSRLEYIYGDIDNQTVSVCFSKTLTVLQEYDITEIKKLGVKDITIFYYTMSEKGIPSFHIRGGRNKTIGKR